MKKSKGITSPKQNSIKVKGQHSKFNRLAHGYQSMIIDYYYYSSSFFPAHGGLHLEKIEFQSQFQKTEQVILSIFLAAQLSHDHGRESRIAVIRVFMSP